MNIFVARLDYEVTSEDLLDVFSPFGEVASANVIMDKYTDRSKGFAFVEMENDDEAREAIAELNDTELMGRTIVVKKAQPRKEKRY